MCKRLYVIYYYLLFKQDKALTSMLDLFNFTSEELESGGMALKEMMDREGFPYVVGYHCPRSITLPSTKVSVWPTYAVIEADEAYAHQYNLVGDGLKLEEYTKSTELLSNWD